MSGISCPFAALQSVIIIRNEASAVRSAGRFQLQLAKLSPRNTRLVLPVF